MKRDFRKLAAIVVSAVALVVSAQAQTPGTGRVEIKPIQAYSGSPALSKPTAIVVYGFAVTPQEVELNKSVLNRIRVQRSGTAEDQKTEVAHKIADSFSDSLIKDLEKTGLPVSKGVTGEAAPDNALAIQGDFLLIDEGNRARRMAIGLGAGASKVVANVECYVKQPSSNVIVTSFKATSRSSLKPGAAETMGAGAAPEVAAAASGVTEVKQSAEGDTSRMAKAISKQVKKAMAAQGWIETNTP